MCGGLLGHRVHARETSNSGETMRLAICESGCSSEESATRTLGNDYSDEPCLDQYQIIAQIDDDYTQLLSTVPGIMSSWPSRARVSAKTALLVCWHDYLLAPAFCMVPLSSWIVHVLPANIQIPKYDWLCLSPKKLPCAHMQSCFWVGLWALPVSLPGAFAASLQAPEGSSHSTKTPINFGLLSL